MDKEQVKQTLQTMLTTIDEVQMQVEKPDINWKLVGDQFEDLSDTASELMFKIQDHLDETEIKR